MSGNPIYNAQGEDFLYAGEIDPTVTAIEAKKGTLFLKTSGSPMLYQKQDAGVSSNWTQLAVGDFLARDFSNAQASANNIDLGANNIVNLADPTAAQHAATKNYVDTQVAAIPSGMATDFSNAVANTKNQNWGGNQLDNVSILSANNSVQVNSRVALLNGATVQGVSFFPGLSGLGSFSTNIYSTDSLDTKDIQILTGNASSTTSGNINLKTGSAGTVRGSITMDGSTISLQSENEQVAEVVHQSTLLSTSWGNPFPAIELDGTTAQAMSDFGVGLLYKGNNNQSQLIIGTQDVDDPAGSSAIDFYTGRNINAAGGTANINFFTGNLTNIANSQSTGTFSFRTGAQSGTGNTGNINLTTGNANSGNSGDIRLTAGASSSGNRGKVRFLSGTQFVLPQLTTDPTNLEDGEIWYNTTSNQLKARVIGVTIVLAP